MNIHPPKWTPKQQKDNWINLLVHVHDLQCHCNNPLEHTLHIIFEKEKNLRLEESTKNLIKPWLTTTAAGEDAHGDDILEDGDLAALFDEDFTEDAG